MRTYLIALDNMNDQGFIKVNPEEGTNPVILLHGFRQIRTPGPSDSAGKMTRIELIKVPGTPETIKTGDIPPKFYFCDRFAFREVDESFRDIHEKQEKQTKAKSKQYAMAR